MPPVRVVIFQEDDGTVPLLEWLAKLPDRAKAKCYVRIQRLEGCGHDLRRPEADYLRDGIYELRVALSGVQYRILYFFRGRSAVALSHGLVKKGAVPPREILRAIERKQAFEMNPELHEYQGEVEK